MSSSLYCTSIPLRSTRFTRTKNARSFCIIKTDSKRHSRFCFSSRPRDAAFQAKEVFSEYGISLLKGAVSTDIGKAREDAKTIGYPMVVKSQVPVGGRGKAGGIQICKNADELSIKYPQVMDLEIKGERARAILIEEAAVIKNEMYLSLFLNRSKRCYTVIASAEGGVEIESVKNQIIKEVGRGNVNEQTASEIASEMGLQGKVADDFKNILVKLSLTVEKEAELAEINPLAILDDGRMVALDGKMVTDDNSNARDKSSLQFLMAGNGDRTMCKMAACDKNSMPRTLLNLCTSSQRQITVRQQSIKKTCWFADLITLQDD